MMRPPAEWAVGGFIMLKSEAKQNISDREKSIVVSQYEEGWPLRKIAAYANMSQTTVMKIVKEAGVKMRENHAVKGEKREEVKRMYAEGCSIREIIRKTGVKSSQTIYTIIQAERRKREKAAR